jgi:hypothetical protein
MYANPAHIRAKRVNLSLSDDEMRVVEAVSALNGKQPSAFLRELVMESLRCAVHGRNSDFSNSELRALHS